MIQYLQELLDSTKVPFVLSLVLGLLTAVSPCQFARNITAIGYISRDIQNPGKVFVNGLFYTIGNAAGYLSLGLILFLGASKFHVSKALVLYGNLVTGFLLLLVGIFMLDIIKTGILQSGKLIENISTRNFRANKFNSSILGFILSLTFCPYNAALFFGILIPMTVSKPGGLYLPLVYSVTSGLPVAIVSYILAFSVAGIGAFYHKIAAFQVWFNRIVASVFIIIGAYYIFRFGYNLLQG